MTLPFSGQDGNLRHVTFEDEPLLFLNDESVAKQTETDLAQLDLLQRIITTAVCKALQNQPAFSESGSHIHVIINALTTETANVTYIVEGTATTLKVDLSQTPDPAVSCAESFFCESDNTPEKKLAEGVILSLRKKRHLRDRKQLAACEKIMTEDFLTKNSKQLYLSCSAQAYPEKFVIPFCLDDTDQILACLKKNDCLSAHFSALYHHYASLSSLEAVQLKEKIKNALKREFEYYLLEKMAKQFLAIVIHNTAFNYYNHILRKTDGWFSAWSDDRKKQLKALNWSFGALFYAGENGHDFTEFSSFCLPWFDFHSCEDITTDITMLLKRCNDNTAGIPAILPYFYRELAEANTLFDKLVNKEKNRFTLPESSASIYQDKNRKQAFLADPDKLDFSWNLAFLQENRSAVHDEKDVEIAIFFYQTQKRRLIERLVAAESFENQDLAAFCQQDSLHTLYETTQHALHGIEQTLSTEANLQPDTIVPARLEKGESLRAMNYRLERAILQLHATVASKIHDNTQQWQKDILATAQALQKLYTELHHKCSVSDIYLICQTLTLLLARLDSLVRFSEQTGRAVESGNTLLLHEKMKQYLLLAKDITPEMLTGMLSQLQNMMHESILRQEAYQEDLRTKQAKCAAEAPARLVLQDLHALFENYLDTLRQREPVHFEATRESVLSGNIPHEIYDTGVSLADKIRVTQAILAITDESTPGREKPRERLGQAAALLARDETQHILGFHRRLTEPDPEGITLLQRAWILLRGFVRSITHFFHPPASIIPFQAAQYRLACAREENPFMLEPISVGSN